MRIRHPRTLLTLGVCLLTLAGDRLHTEETQNGQTLSIAPDTSQVTIHVGKAGLFGFAGHPHVVIAPGVDGEVRFDPDDLAQSSVRIEVDAGSLRVTGEDEPAEDVPEVQRVMLSEDVLDVERFPTITFQSRTLALAEGGETRLVIMMAGDSDTSWGDPPTDCQGHGRDAS